jgi:hypothetical protein
MTQATIIGDDVRTVDATADGEKLLVGPEQLDAAMGWKLEPQGLCRGDVCVPVRDQPALFDGDRLDVAAVARALGRLVVVDAAAGLMAMAADPAARKQALSLDAPAFTLDDLDGNPHSLSEWRGRKKLLFAFASW